MEKSYKKLLENNKAWALLEKNRDPDFFEDLATRAKP
jgi:hypothetical protein